MEKRTDINDTNENYKELVEFLFECPEINLMIKEAEYIMDAEEAFNLMHEYKRTGELPLCQPPYEYE